MEKFSPLSTPLIYMIHIRIDVAWCKQAKCLRNYRSFRESFKIQHRHPRGSHPIAPPLSITPSQSKLLPFPAFSTKFVLLLYLACPGSVSRQLWEVWVTPRTGISLSITQLCQLLLLSVIFYAIQCLQSRKYQSRSRCSQLLRENAPPQHPLAQTVRQTTTGSCLLAWS